MGRKYLQIVLPAVAAALIGAPALADNKAGVDAWSRGDFPAAAREWQGDAARGDADAMFNLAQAYKLGRGVKQDLGKAEELFGRAARLGHLQASDNYGLFLFQRGERRQALPYIRAAADRGDPRAQYLLGLAHFNGENVPRDPVRAYALVSLAQEQGLDAAQAARARMDQYIPMEQRQQAIALAAQLQGDAQATRARQLAAVDLGATVPTAPPEPPAPQRAGSAGRTGDPIAAAVQLAAGSTPASAGADYARPQIVRPAPPVVTAAAPGPVRARETAVAVAATAVTSVVAPAASGPWRVQLGAFGQSANADALWAKLRGRPELAGHPRINVRAGAVIKLQAGGYASEAAARAACTRLAASGQTCIAARN